MLIKQIFYKLEGIPVDPDVTKRLTQLLQQRNKNKKGEKQ